MTTAKRKIHKFDFKSEGAHVALVDKAANLQEVLVMKASEDEVTVSMSMRKFLEKFFNLWYEDAAALAGILGYSTGDESSQTSVDSYINGVVDSVQLLKGVEIPDAIPESIFNKVEELNKQFGDQVKASKGSSQEDNINIEKGESQVDKTEIEVQELEQLRKAAAEVETFKSAMTEVETLKSELQAMRDAKAQKEKDDMTEVVKGYSFIADEDREAVVSFLTKSEDASVILTALEKARDAIAAAIDTEQGAEGGDSVEEETTEKSVDLTTQILKSRNS